MKKYISILFALVLMFAAFPLNALANEGEIKDGTYDIIAKAMHAKEDKASGAASFISEEAQLVIANGKATFVVTIPKNSFASVTGIQVEGVEPSITEDEIAVYMAFALPEIKSSLLSQVQYEVPSMGMIGDEPFIFVLEGLDKLPVVEEQPEEPTEPEVPGEGEEEPDPEPEEPEETPTKEFKELITDADESYEINYVSESRAVNGQFNNPATLHVIEGKNYIQMDVKNGEIINWLTINGVSLDWGEKNEDGTFTVQFEHPGKLSDQLDFGMEIQAGPELMEHTVDLTFDENSKKLIEDETDGVKFILDPDRTQYVEYISESPAVNRQFDNPAAVIVKDGKTYIQMNGTGGQYITSLTINGEEVTWGERNEDGTFTFQFELLGSLTDALDFGMVIDTGRPGMDPMEHVVDLTFDESTLRDTVEIIEEEEKEEEPEEPTKPEVPEAIGELVPDKASEILYTILQENNDDVSAAMNFMEEKAILLEKDGVKYLQISTKADSGKYIKSLRVKLGNSYQEMVVVDKTADGRTIYQLKVTGDISDVILLDMIIDVEGVYENRYHKARLFLDSDSAVEVDASNYLLVASTNDNCPEAPEGEEAVNPDEETERPVTEVEKDTNNNNGDPGIEKPDLGDAATDETIAAASNSGNPTNNPQTGENTNLLLYVLLLVGSAVPLAIQARKRFVA